MNRIYLMLALAVMVLTGCTTKLTDAGPSAEEGPYVVDVSLSGMRCCDSSVLVALYRSDADWLQRDRVFKARMVLSKGEIDSFTFYGLPAGTYAVAAFQDLNHNGTLDRWFGLLPREPVAFSRVNEWRLPPSFSEASFVIPGETTVEVSF